eukprot:4967574-Amphidinium_carterae.1
MATAADGKGGDFSIAAMHVSHLPSPGDNWKLVARFLTPSLSSAEFKILEKPDPLPTTNTFTPSVSEVVLMTLRGAPYVRTLMV